MNVNRPPDYIIHFVDPLAPPNAQTHTLLGTTPNDAVYLPSSQDEKTIRLDGMMDGQP